MNNQVNRTGEKLDKRERKENITLRGTEWMAEMRQK